MKAKRKPATKATRNSEVEFHQKLGHAYCDQEGDISDLLTMAEIAARATMGEKKGEAIFTAHHLRDMIDDFRQEWYDRHKVAQSKAEAAS
jgi:predicted DsbA family dithiol-disulfide isomerase